MKDEYNFPFDVMPKELKEEITCRLDYYKQLLNMDTPQNLMEYYKGCYDSLNSILMYMELGINWDSLKESE